MSDYDDWDDYEVDDDISTSVQSTKRSKNEDSSSYDDYPHLFLSLGRQKFYTPFLFYLIMIVFMGLMIFNYMA
jgi:hypothetical protein